MMKNLLYIVILFLATGCLDDKSNYKYDDINDFEYGSYKVTNIQDSYTIYPGEELTIEPNVRLNIDTLALNVRYEWYVGAELMGTDKVFKYKTDKIGTSELTFCTIDKATGVSFPTGSEIVVKAPLESGWLLLTKSASGESQISMVLGKKSSRFYINESGYQKTRDTVIYSDVQFDLAPGLGNGPIKVVENLAFGPRNETQKSEIMILQESGAVELDGTFLKYVARPTDEFSGAAPAGFLPKNAVLTWGTKWLLNRTDNKLYGCLSPVTSDLHSGSYMTDPAFNGRQIKDLVPMNKAAIDPYDNYKMIVAIDHTNTMFAILDNGKPTDQYKNDFTMYYKNNNGASAELMTDDADIDMSLFKNFSGEYIYHTYLEMPDFLSLISRNGTYYWHQYSLDVSYKYESGPIPIKKSTTGELNAAMFSDFVDAGVLSSREVILVASGNELYASRYLKNDRGNLIKGDFSSRIAGIAVKDFSNDMYNCHLGVVLEDGNFYVYEVVVEEDEPITFKEVFHRNLRDLNPNFGKVVDFVVKYGNGDNLGSAYKIY